MLGRLTGKVGRPTLGPSRRSERKVNMARKGKEFDEWTTVAVVKSKSVVGVEYQVKKKGSGQWKCNCLGNQYGHVCWHMRAAWALGQMARKAGMDAVGSEDGRVQVMRTEAY